MNQPNQICCPKCGSNQITANKKGFSGGKAVAGAILTGGIGLLAGTIGSNKVLITCLNCAHQFKPGSNKKTIVANPKLIWDDLEKKHVINPKGRNDTVTAPLWQVLIIILILIIVVVFFIHIT